VSEIGECRWERERGLRGAVKREEGGRGVRRIVGLGSNSFDCRGGYLRE